MMKEVGFFYPNERECMKCGYKDIKAYVFKPRYSKKLKLLCRKCADGERK